MGQGLAQLRRLPSSLSVASCIALMHQSGLSPDLPELCVLLWSMFELNQRAEAIDLLGNVGGDMVEQVVASSGTLARALCHAYTALVRAVNS